MPDDSPIRVAPILRVELPPRVHETPEDEAAVAIPDVPVETGIVPAAGTVSIEIVPEQAIAAGEAYATRAALAAAASAPVIPPLPAEPKPTSRHARRWAAMQAKAATSEPGFAYEPYLTPREGARPAPEGFWRELAYGVTLTLWNPGDSRSVRARKALDARIGAPVEPARLVPVLSRHGGVGSTTVTALLGMALADVRGDGVTVVDGDLAMLADRIDSTSPLTVAASPYDDATRSATVVLADGAAGDLRSADSLVLVSGGTSEQARLASETVSWLEDNDLAELAGNAVVAINTSTPGTRYESLDAIEAHFQARVREVVRIPYDEELVAGAPIRYGALRPDTRDAARDLAAKVIDGITAPTGRAA